METALLIVGLIGLLGAIAGITRKQNPPVTATTSATTPKLTTPLAVATPATLNDLYRKYGTITGIDWRLIKAVATVESSENPNAENKADPSVGLMQILCKPDANGICSNKFNLPGWPVSKQALFDPDTNLKFGSAILKWNLDTYGFPRGIAVYNNWSARTDPETGPFKNQSYVDKVLTIYNGLLSPRKL